jgi:sulfur relay (sulfurtransferase) complex TusBCD TusD component (DsrE family)
MFENSKHSEAVWSNSFAQGSSSQNNSLGNCIRCHDARGYVNFTKGLTTNTTGMVEADHNFITCPSCHDPHGNDQDYALRKVPVGSDTLANGFQYTAFGGLGQVCLNCHKGRKDNVSYTVTPPNNSHWGPHHSTQGDIFLGQNAALFGTTPYPTNTHKYAVTNACVDCHMYATTDTGTVTRDRVGGHSWNMNDPDNNFDNTAACYSCHGPLNSFEDFIAPADYDGDGTVESIPEEFDGTLANLRYWLPPTGVDSVDWQLIQQFNNETITKAYFNYLLIEADGSSGLHNSKFEFAVLLASIQALGGVVPVELTSFNAVLNDKTVNLDWETASETNNRGFEVQKKSGNSWVKIGFVNGNGTTSDIKQYAYTDKLDESQISGKITYRLQQVDYDGKTQLSKEVSVEFTSGPKEFALLQNYPNPFNPTTNIQFTLPYDSKVKLVVYNITGQVVSELINSVQAAGEHSVQFSTAAVNVASGIYFYTIEASSLNGSKTFRQTKKMVLLK